VLGTAIDGKIEPDLPGLVSLDLIVVDLFCIVDNAFGLSRE